MKATPKPRNVKENGALKAGDLDFFMTSKPSADPAKIVEGLKVCCSLTHDPERDARLRAVLKSAKTNVRSLSIPKCLTQKLSE